MKKILFLISGILLLFLTSGTCDKINIQSLGTFILETSGNQPYSWVPAGFSDGNIATYGMDSGHDQYNGKYTFRYNFNSYNTHMVDYMKFYLSMCQSGTLTVKIFTTTQTIEKSLTFATTTTGYGWVTYEIDQTVNYIDFFAPAANRFSVTEMELYSLNVPELSSWIMLCIGFYAILQGKKILGEKQ